MGLNGLTSYMLCYRGNRLVPLIPRLLRLTNHDLREGGTGGRASARPRRVRERGSGCTCGQAQRLRRGHDPALALSQLSLTRSRRGTRPSLPPLSPSSSSKSTHYRWVSINSAKGVRPMVNFINVLWADFTPEDPKRAKRHRWLDCFFELLGSALAKAARKMLVKSTPGGEEKRSTKLFDNFDAERASLLSRRSFPPNEDSD